MMKQAFRSYIASIHPRNIKNLKEKAPGWWVYVLIIGLYVVPAILLEGSPQNWTASYILLLLPMLFMTWSDLNSKYLMSKRLFLCPMKKEEREEYIRCVLICKISGALVVGVLVWVIWCMDYGVQIWRLGMMLFIYASAGIATYISYEYRIVEIGQKTPWVIYEKDGKKIYPHLGTILICAVFLEMGAFAYLDFTPEILRAEKVFPFFAAGVGIVFIAMVILDIVIIKGQFPYVTENIGDYGKNFKITQVKKPVQVKYDLFEKKR